MGYSSRGQRSFRRGHVALSIDGYHQDDEVASEYDAQNEEIGNGDHGDEFVAGQEEERSHG